MSNDDKNNKNNNDDEGRYRAKVEVETYRAKRTMRAALASDHGPIRERLSVVDDATPVPRLSDSASFSPKERDRRLVVRTLAVSLAPGDARVLSGATRRFQGPPSFPYVPGGDLCGVVVDVPEHETYFAPGDVVAARFVVGPRGALGEYAFVHRSACDKVPTTTSGVVAVDPAAAAAAAGASPAVVVAARVPESAERVLVLGASGGLGSHLCQLLKKRRGVKRLVGVITNSDDVDRVRTVVGCDRVHVDGRRAGEGAGEFWSRPELLLDDDDDEPFDVVVDLAGAGGWLSLLEQRREQRRRRRGDRVRPLVKPARRGGLYLAAVPDTAVYDLPSVPAALRLFLTRPAWRSFRSRTWRRSDLPVYAFGIFLPERRDEVTTMLSAITATKNSDDVTPCLANDGKPFPFTTEGVRAAFELQESRHTRGKVVVKISDL